MFSQACMAFSVYDFDRVACQSLSWFVLYALNYNKPATRLTSDASDFVDAKNHAT